MSLNPFRWRKQLSVGTLDSYFPVDDIACVDADGHVFEQYDRLYVAADIERDDSGQPVYFTPYNAVRHFEQKGNGVSLPSNALQINLLVRIFSEAVELQSNGSYNTKNPTAKRILDQYKNYGSGFGWHAANTLTDYGAEEIIDYPSAGDFGKQAVANTNRRTSRPFSKQCLRDCSLEDALRDEAHLRFLKQYTGLRDPSVLMEVSAYFGKPVRLWFPWSGSNGSLYAGKGAAWFGCYVTNLFLYASISLYNASAARGVSPFSPAGRRAEQGALSLAPTQNLEGAVSVPASGGDLSLAQTGQGELSLADQQEPSNRKRKFILF